MVAGASPAETVYSNKAPGEGKMAKTRGRVWQARDMEMKLRERRWGGKRLELYEKAARLQDHTLSMGGKGTQLTRQSTGCRAIQTHNSMQVTNRERGSGSPQARRRGNIYAWHEKMASKGGRRRLMRGEACSLGDDGSDLAARHTETSRAGGQTGPPWRREAASLAVEGSQRRRLQEMPGWRDGRHCDDAT